MSTHTYPNIPVTKEESVSRGEVAFTIALLLLPLILLLVPAL